MGSQNRKINVFSFLALLFLFKVLETCLELIIFIIRYSEFYFLNKQLFSFKKWQPLLARYFSVFSIFVLYNFPRHAVHG